MNKVVFQIIFMRCSSFSQPAVYFEKSPSQMKIDEEHLFWGTACGVLFNKIVQGQWPSFQRTQWDSQQVHIVIP